MPQDNDRYTRPKCILFDVYGTLLDMSEIVKKVNNLVDSKRGYIVWDGLLMQYCFVDNCTAQFNEFDSIAKATLKMTAQVFRKSIAEDDINQVLMLLQHLPIQSEVAEGLSLLNDQGFRIAALTNSPEKIVRTRMEATGLISYFEMLLSSESIKKYKPSLEVYKWAAGMLKTETRDILFVSTQGWDITGAANAGMQTAYIKQDDQLLYPLAPQPDFICNNIIELTNHLADEIRKEP